jgi:hypothetical protein
MRRLCSVVACLTLIVGLTVSEPATAQRFHGSFGDGFRGGVFRPGMAGAQYFRPGFGGAYRVGGYTGYWRGGGYPGWRRGYAWGGYPRYWRGRPYWVGYPGWGYPGWYPGYNWYDSDWAPFAAAAIIAPLVVAATTQPYADAPLGGFCATPIRTCQLYSAAPIGTGCSCRVAGGRARGDVTN